MIRLHSASFPCRGGEGLGESASDPPFAGREVEGAWRGRGVARSALPGGGGGRRSHDGHHGRPCSCLLNLQKYLRLGYVHTEKFIVS